MILHGVFHRHPKLRVASIENGEPHGEGLAQPLDFAKELAGFGEAETRRILRDNALELLGA